MPSVLAVVGLAVSLGLAYASMRNVDLDAFWEALRTSEYAWLLPALAMLAVAVAVRAVRWMALFPPETRPPLGATARALLVGYFFNTILPARAGEAARIVVLNQEAQVSKAQSVGTAVTERLYDVVTLLLLLFVAAPFLPALSWLRTAAVLALVLSLVLLAVVVILDRYGTRPVLFVMRPLTRFSGVSAGRIERLASNLTAGLGALHRPGIAVPAFVLTVVSWLLLAGSFWLALEAFDLGVGAGAALLVLITTNLAMVIPSLPAAIGVFEAATVVALGAYGVDESSALSYAVVLHALNVFPYLVVGYIVLHHHTRTQLVRRRAPHEEGARG